MAQSEPKREEFQRYLEKSGVIDALTKVLVGLYEVPDKPVNAIDFIKEYLGSAINAETEKLKSTVESQSKQLLAAEQEIATLRKQIDQLTAANSNTNSNTAAGEK